MVRRGITRDLLAQLPHDINVDLWDTMDRYDLVFRQGDKSIAVPGVLVSPKPGTPQSCGILLDPPRYAFTYLTKNEQEDREFVSVVLESARSRPSVANTWTSDHRVLKNKMFLFLEVGIAENSLGARSRRITLVEYRKPQPIPVMS